MSPVSQSVSQSLLEVAQQTEQRRENLLSCDDDNDGDGGGGGGGRDGEREETDREGLLPMKVKLCGKLEVKVVPVMLLVLTLAVQWQHGRGK